MKQLLSSIALAAALAVAHAPAAFAEQKIFSFPSPERIQVKAFLESFLSIAGPAKDTEIHDFCELNKEQFKKRLKECSARTWIEKDQPIMLSL